jgi:hypothetical protein
VVAKLMYEIISDEELLQLDKAGWHWSGDLGPFACTIGSDPPPIVARMTIVGQEPDDLKPVTTGPTLVAIPRFHETSVERAQECLEALLSGWVAHLELAEGLAIRFAYRAAWLAVGEGDDRKLVRHNVDAAWGGTMRIINSLDEVPPRPPDWLADEPEFVRLLREQWREARVGRAKMLDRAYYCLTAIAQQYGSGSRLAAADALGVSRPVLDKIGQLTAVSDTQHGRKLGSGVPRALGEADAEWLKFVVPRVILRCAEVELRVPDRPQLTMSDFPYPPNCRGA